MIPSSQEILYRTYGAWRLACFDAGGAQFFDTAREAAVRSFFAAVLVAPAFIIPLLMQSDQFGDTTALTIALVYFFCYVLEWTVYPVVVHQICQMIDREQAFFRYLTAANWSAMISAHLVLFFTILVAGNVIPEAVLPIVKFALQAYLLGYFWFLTRHCLDVGAPAAVGFVALRFFMEVFIYAIAYGIVASGGSA